MSDVVHPNPFESPGRPEKQLRLKCCLWKVLQHFPNGLTVSELVAELQNRGLKDFSERRNAAGQVSGDLVRHREAFVHDPHRRVWFIKPLAPKGLPCKTTATKSRPRRHSCAKHNTTLNAKTLQTPKENQLVGYSVRVWWSEDAKFFQGKIVSYEPTTNSYGILYDDGDTEFGVQFRKYEVLSTDSGCESVVVYETGDDLEIAAASTITLLANSTIPTTNNRRKTYLKHEAAQELPMRNVQDGQLQPLKSLVTEALCTLNKTSESYERELSMLKEMFYTMRGCNDAPAYKNMTLKQLAERLEQAALDIGIFANTIDEERGLHRLNKFCFEGFIQVARALEHQVDITVKHSLHLSQQVIWLIPDTLTQQAKEIVQETKYEGMKDSTNNEEECSLLTLKKAQRRFQQFSDMLSDV